MAYGFKLFGSHGDVQIDQDYRNPMLVGSGTCTSAQRVNGVVTLTYTNQGTNTVPQIYIRPSADTVHVGSSVVTPTTTTLWLDSGSFDWVAFGLTSPVMIDSASNFGMRVLDSSGALCYDSRYEVARGQTVLHVNSQPWPDAAAGGSTSPTYPQTLNFTGWGTRPWINVNQLGRTYMGSEESGEEYGWVVRTSGTDSVILRFASIGGTGGTTWTFYDGGTSLARSFPGGNADIPILRRYTD